MSCRHSETSGFPNCWSEGSVDIIQTSHDSAEQVVEVVRDTDRSVPVLQAFGEGVAQLWVSLRE